MKLAIMDFVLAALPWLCTGLALALCAVNHNASKRAKRESKEQGNYMTEGMCIGMCAVAMAFGTEYLSYGMLLGLAAGMCISSGHVHQEVGRWRRCS